MDYNFHRMSASAANVNMAILFIYLFIHSLQWNCIEVSYVLDEIEMNIYHSHVQAFRISSNM